MKFTWFGVLAGLVLCFVGLSVQVGAQSPAEPGPQVLASGPYQPGEHLTYTASFASFTAAAHAEIWIAGRGQYLDRDGLELRARVATTDIVSAAMYAINNDYTTYVDPTTGQPYYTRISIHEGGRSAEFSNQYNAAAGTSAMAPKVNKGEFLGVYDFLSAAYRLRAVPFNNGGVYRFTLRGENSQYEVEAKPVGRQMVKSSIGSFTTLVVQLRFPDDSDLNDYRIKIYFTADERRVPLLATARHPNGDIRVEISSSEIIQPVRPANAAGPPVVAQTPRPPAASAAPTGIPSGAVPLNSGGNIPGIPGFPGTMVKPVPSGAANPSGGLAVKPFPSELPFTADEILNYTVFLQGAGQPVGVVSFRVNGRNFYFGSDSLMVSVKAETANAAQKLFLASEQITSYLDPVSLLPNRTDLALLGYRSAQSDTIQMDQDRGAAAGKRGQMEMPVGTHDVLSLVYALRAFDLSPGKTSVLPLLANGQVHQLTINSIKRETIQLGNLKIPAFQLTVLMDGADPDVHGLRLWISDDIRRLPLRLTAKTPAGQISADLAISPK